MTDFRCFQCGRPAGIRIMYDDGGVLCHECGIEKRLKQQARNERKEADKASYAHEQGEGRLGEGR